MSDQLPIPQPDCPAKCTIKDHVPMAHVADVQRSIEFYALLGFTCHSRFSDDQGVPYYAAVSNHLAELMFARASGPIDPTVQAVLFYMYCDDVSALRDHLLSKGYVDGGLPPSERTPQDCLSISPTGPIVFQVTHPDYMQEGEIRLHDPDGYVILVGQSERRIKQTALAQQVLSVFVMLAGIFALALLSQSKANAQEADEPKLSWEIGSTGSNASFRGISSPNEMPSSVWVCGSNSTVLLSTDGGVSWNDRSPSQGELEFRSIKAFDDQRAVIASAGTPAIVMLTEDGGQTWREVYRHDAKTAFFDAMQFWDSRRGMLVSDPIDGHFLLVETSDGGATWQALPTDRSPPAEAGEACFAASNSAMLLGEGGEIWIGTGGSERGFARVLHRAAGQEKWNAYSTPISSSPSSGIFSLAHWGAPEPQIVAVGGDYRAGQPSSVTSARSCDQGQTWLKSDEQSASFRSAVLGFNSADANLRILVAVGPEGSDYSLDTTSWQSFSSHGFHALCSAGTHVYATGSSGRFARLAPGVKR